MGNLNCHKGHNVSQIHLTHFFDLSQFLHCHVIILDDVGYVNEQYIHTKWFSVT